MSNLYAGKTCFVFSIAALSLLEIGPGNSLNVVEWIEATQDLKQRRVCKDWYNAFRETYKSCFPDSDDAGFDHEFGTIIMNAKHDKLMSYGRLVSTYYHNNSCPNLVEIHILRQDRYE